MAKKAKTNNARLLGFFILLVITAAIALTVILVQRQQNIQQHAASTITTSPCPHLGDVNGDGNVTSVDALLILRHVASLPTVGFHSENADVNGIGGINAVDALLINRFVAGLGSDSWACNSISGKVFIDANNNRALDSGEVGYNSNGVKIVTLAKFYENNMLLHTATDNNGNFIFDKLPKGNYQITYQVPGYLPTNIPAVINKTIPPSHVQNLGIRKQ